ncbi:hypothetical protein AVEN_81845-1 [Araneus ventricosus]|uniref:Uncharacterized protein n=1 Tax=Araneus ventricosus TaxID=182803 RepID=A0A4Y2IF57_ARAVE|nr:hypothetical protein AVEN_81845-1 [Araneus ventricosus]
MTSAPTPPPEPDPGFAIGLKHANRTSCQSVHLLYTGLLWAGPCNYEPWSDDEKDTYPGTTLSKLLHHTSEMALDFKSKNIKPTYTGDIWCVMYPQMEMEGLLLSEMRSSLKVEFCCHMMGND